MAFKNTLLQGLSKRKYLEFIRSMPQFQKEKTEAYLILLLTIITVSFFGVFAIAPTLSTIAQLHKTLEDSTFVDEQLDRKINSMSSLQTQYNSLSPNLPVLEAAIPQKDNSTLLLGQVQALGQQNGLSISRLQVQEVTERGAADQPTGAMQTFTISAEASGSYEQLQTFYNQLVNFERILTIDSLIITKTEEDGTQLKLSLKAKAYFYQP